MELDEGRLLNALRAVKSTPRTGWMLRGVPAAIAEPIASHLAESAVLALTIASEFKRLGGDVDPFKAASIALVHDMAEAFIGDIVKKAIDAIGKELKETIEVNAAREGFGDTLLYKLIEEYVRQETVEAKIAKYAELLSTMVQALRYYRLGYDVSEIVCTSYVALEKRGHLPWGRIGSRLFEESFRQAKNLCKNRKD